jgi:hypothetical protein
MLQHLPIESFGGASGPTHERPGRAARSFHGFRRAAFELDTPAGFD